MSSKTSKRTVFITLFALLVLVVGFLFWVNRCQPIFSCRISDVVKLDSGSIRGKVDGEMKTYLGIPYVAPPIGNLRWRPPAAVHPWEGIREVVKAGHACPQPDAVDPQGAFDSMSEDCLTLNVWTPAMKTGEKLPVMVWIHGGGFVAGNSFHPWYFGGHLAQKGAVVVTINYRLGPLGFLAHPLLSQESSQGVSGNYGLLDQIAALKWVKKNIRAFGGDPGNVTIFGESAGAMSVTYLMVSPLAKGLFHKAISESGTPVIAQYFFPDSYGPLYEAYQTGEKFEAAIGCDGEENPLACMRNKTGEELTKACDIHPEVYYIDKFPFPPVFDGWVIPAEPVSLYRNGKIAKVPLIIGTNKNEGTLFISPIKNVGRYESWASLLFHKDASGVIKRFPAEREDLFEVFDRVYTLALFTQPARLIARSVVSVLPDVYKYQFTRVALTEEGKRLGSVHGAEIPYVFGNMTAAEGYSEEDMKLSRAIMDYWVQFARTGDPNTGELVTWPAYNSEDDNYLEFNSAVQVKSKLDERECDFFEKILLGQDSSISPGSSAPVSVHHEWGKLEEVIVGTARDFILPPWVEGTIIPDFPDPKVIDYMKNHGGEKLSDVDPESSKRMVEEMDHLAQVLRDRGIVVHIAGYLTPEEKKFITPGRTFLFPRDPVVIIGNNIIETSPRALFRRKEKYGIRPILQKYVGGPEANYVSIPPAPPEVEDVGPFLEGGDILLNGHEIYVGHSGVASNRLGIDWLQNYLGPEYKVHEVKLQPEILHLDCAMSLLRPQLGLLCRECLAGDLPDSIKGWDFIEVSKEEAENLGANVFVLDDTTVITSKHHHRIAEEMRKKGQEVIEIDFGEVSKYGGAFRCAHHPIRRVSRL